MNNSRKLQNGNCQICLSKSHRKGKTDGCSHVFCFKCLKKLAKRENACPICKEAFTKIIKVQKQRKSEIQKVTHAGEKKDLKLSQLSQSLIGQQTGQKQDQAEKNIFSVFLGPNTRDNQTKFLQMYCVMMGWDKEE